MITRILILVGLCIAASTTRALDVIDVGVYVPEPYPGRSSISWLDDERFMFAGYRTADELPLRLKQVTSRLFEYNITTQKLIDKGVSGISVCYDNGYVRYSRPRTEQKPEAPFPEMQPYYGRYGEEQPLPPRRQAVPSDTQLLWNCLYDSELPPMPEWMAEAKKQGRIFSRLRPEHGWVEITIKRAVLLEWPSKLYASSGSPGDVVPLDVFNDEPIQTVLWKFYSFKNAYLVPQRASPLPQTGNYKLWWLHPDGRTELAMHAQFDGTHIWSGFLASKVGYLSSLDRGRRKPLVGNIANAGLYLFDPSGSHRKLVVGTIRTITISPNGCKVAYGNDDRIDNQGITKLKLQVIDVCTEQ